MWAKAKACLKKCLLYSYKQVKIYLATPYSNKQTEKYFKLFYFPLKKKNKSEEQEHDMYCGLRFITFQPGAKQTWNTAVLFW